MYFQLSFINAMNTRWVVNLQPNHVHGNVNDITTSNVADDVSNVDVLLDMCITVFLWNFRFFAEQFILYNYMPLSWIQVHIVAYVCLFCPLLVVGQC